MFALLISLWDLISFRKNIKIVLRIDIDPNDFVSHFLFVISWKKLGLWIFYVIPISKKEINFFQDGSWLIAY